MNKILIGLVLVLAGTAAQSHGDEDHGAPAVVAASASLLPRATAQTDLFELVAVLTPASSATRQGGSATQELTLYLDRFATNEPVDGATVELESGAFKGNAKRIATGVYVVSGEAFAVPGRYPLTVSVQTSDAADLIDVVFQHDAKLAPTHIAGTFSVGRWSWLGGGGLLMAVAWFAWRRRKNSRKSGETL